MALQKHDPIWLRSMLERIHLANLQIGNVMLVFELCFWSAMEGGTYVLLPMDAMMGHNSASNDEYHFSFHAYTHLDYD